MRVVNQNFSISSPLVCYGNSDIGISISDANIHSIKSLYSASIRDSVRIEAYNIRSVLVSDGR